MLKRFVIDRKFNSNTTYIDPIVHIGRQIGHMYTWVVTWDTLHSQPLLYCTQIQWKTSNGTILLLYSMLAHLRSIVKHMPDEFIHNRKRSVNPRSHERYKSYDANVDFWRRNERLAADRESMFNVAQILTDNRQSTSLPTHHLSNHSFGDLLLERQGQRHAAVLPSTLFQRNVT